MDDHALAARMSEAEHPWTVVLQPRRPTCLLSTFPADFETAEAALAEAFGTAAPRTGLSAKTNDGNTLLGLSPGRWLWVGDAEADLPDVRDAALVVIDQSHLRDTYRVSGADMKEFWRTNIPIDPLTVPVGGVLQTSLHHCPVILHQPAVDEVELSVMKSMSTFLHSALAAH